MIMAEWISIHSLVIIHEQCDSHIDDGDGVVSHVRGDDEAHHAHLSVAVTAEVI